MNNTRLYNIIALVMLGLFFLPFIWKVRELDLIVVLVLGLIMPAYDFLTHKD